MNPWAIFLGGRDLEMVEIAKLVTGRADVDVHDRQLPWGATASAYTAEIRAALDRGRSVIVVELPDDLPADVPRERITWVDHHGACAGADRPTTVEQVFALLGFASDQWTRDLTLVAANDRGHIRALQAAGATPEEIAAIRARDRQAQGITASEEAEGRAAAGRAETRCAGRLTVVRLPHARTATVTDVLDAGLGGPGYANLVVFCPGQTVFFGSGRCIDALRKSYPDGWHGGELPERGYWGLARSLAESEILPRLETAIVTKPAAEIAVKAFHHTLLWPLLMRQGTDTQDKPIQPFIQAFEAAAWVEQGVESNGVHPDYDYAEVVYFHPFVRDFLFGDGDTPKEKRSLRRFKRTDITGVTVDIKPDAAKPEEWFVKTLRVERVELFLIRPRVAMLMIEVSNRNHEINFDPSIEPKLAETRGYITLAEVLQLQSRLRRIYPPFFLKGQYGECAASVTWHGKGFACPPAETESDFRAFVVEGAEPPVFAHWQAFFQDAHGRGSVRPLRSLADLKTDGLFLQQLLDDRMPGLSFIAVDNPDEIQEKDCDLFPAFDPLGFNYQEAFTDGLRDSFRYTRFSHYGTTYYCNGTSLTTVCNTSVFNGKCFSDLLLGHFRRHYTHLAVIAQFQHAALLYFAGELAGTPKGLAGRRSIDEYANPAWRDRIRRLQQRFLKFRTRSYFTEVSNQIQPKDLFRLWTGHLGTADLFARVSATNGEMYEAIEGHEVKELSAEQANLGRIAAIFLPLSLALSLLSVLFAGDFLPSYAKLAEKSDGIFDLTNSYKSPHSLAILTVAILAVAGMVSCWLYRKKSPPKAKQL